jgi:hypothetical protein
MLKTDNGWQLIGVQSSARRRKTDGEPITGPYPSPVFAIAGSAGSSASALPEKKGNGLSGEFYHDHTRQQQYQSYPAFVI